VDDGLGRATLFLGAGGYVPLYAFGVFLVRSLAWNVATFGIILILLSLVF
jgi:uncharacterized MAPEG superfamily protein